MSTRRFLTFIKEYQVLKSDKLNLGPKYSFLISDVIHLHNEVDANLMTPEHLAPRLLKIVNDSGAFKRIDRICLALSTKGSAKVSVFSSFNSERVGENTMQGDYHCFVSPESSLLRTRITDMRTYSDVDDILRTYQGRPPQKSIQRLQSMGLKSGLSIPLSISNLVSGYLFFNSKEIGEFSNLSPEDYCFLCLIKIIATQCLYQKFTRQMGFDSRLEKILASQVQSKNQFSGPEFEKILTEALKTRFQIQPKLFIEKQVNKNYFFAINPAIYVIIKAFENAPRIPQNLSIEFRELASSQGPQVELRLRNLDLKEEVVPELKNLLLFNHHEVSLEKGDLILRSNLELANEFDYSVESA